MTLRLTTTAPVGFIEDERLFRVERPLHFFLGPDETFTDDLRIALDTMLDRTIREWQSWVRGLATPVEWQEAVIRAAITLKLCQHEETGAIVAALTTSIPEHADSGRNWDYRYCWIRDAYYTVQALNRWARSTCWKAISNICATSSTMPGAATSSRSMAWAARRSWRNGSPAGWRAIAAWGRCAWATRPMSRSSTTPMARSCSPTRRASSTSGCCAWARRDDFRALERVGERAWATHDKPDAGLWELRTRSHVHTYSAAMCWAACDRLANAATALGLPERAIFWSDRATIIRKVIEEKAWRQDGQHMSATFGGDNLDASLIQLLDLRFFSPQDPRFLGTLDAVEKGLRRGGTMLRYATEDDFGLPKTAFNFCTFWLIEALHFTGRTQEARELFEEMLTRRTTAGLLSEDIDPASWELWGNYPQTYSLVGLINCAVMLSKPWSAVR